jgi:hypothetical protein
MNSFPRNLALLALLLAALVSFGCSPSTDTGGGSEMENLAQRLDQQKPAEPAAEPTPPPVAATPPAPESDTTAAEPAEPPQPQYTEAREVTARDPRKGRVFHNQPGYLNAVFSARFIAENQMTFNKVTHAVDLYEATNGHNPKSHEEFMSEIIEANYIQLPELVDDYEYWYDAEDGVLKMRKPIPMDEAGGQPDAPPAE